MTTLMLNYSQSLLKDFVNGLKHFLQKTMLGIQLARQQQANTLLADQLYRSGDYRPKTKHQICHDLDVNSYEWYEKEIKRISSLEG